MKKKTGLPNPVKSLGYIKYYSLSSSNLLKALEILSDATVRRSAVDQEDLKLYWKQWYKQGVTWKTCQMMNLLMKF